MASSTNTTREKPSSRYRYAAVSTDSSDPRPTARTTAVRSRRPNVPHDRWYRPDPYKDASLHPSTTGSDAVKYGRKISRSSPSNRMRNAR
ncbi:hypothetical protein D3C83_46110 [compost metagenome]